MNEIEQDGYEAHGQNTMRDENPYINRALSWDKGWVEREKQRLTHVLEKDKIAGLGIMAISFGRIIHGDAID